MITTIWAVLMPFLVALAGAVLLKRYLFVGQSTQQHINRVMEVVLSEREAEIRKENKATLFIMGLLPKVQNILDIEHFVLSDIKSMFALMGIKTKAEKELAVYIAKGLLGALPILALPLITGFPGYFALYPVFVLILSYQQYNNLKKKYKKWQLEMTKDLPELIDKLRISFASGRDYISAFNQAKENSGIRMKIIIDKLINDLQSMRPSHALDLFAESFKMPVVTKFASAVKIAIERGPDAAESYFKMIEEDITEVRRVAIEELTKAKPEKAYQLYIIIIVIATGSLLIKGWEIFSQVNKIM